MSPLQFPSYEWKTIEYSNAKKRLAAQVTILRKEKKDQESILKRQKRRPGKREVIKGHFMLSAAEIRDNVWEVTTYGRRKGRPCGRRQPNKQPESASDKKHHQKARKRL
ncbi:hypothetical protein FGG08_000491 [Glutinoglossum americanum]|uniref:Uncharacterized protein n=1 Tax=Glutinoglossum americanum TaxID=1670608 RepID=A0A9P8L607_9PEZI|nr:hypothetical protein FGG08_000491 [Glutinoglossum americanum]